MTCAHRLCMAIAVTLAALAVSYSVQADEDYGPFKEMATAAGTVLAVQ